MNVGIRIYLWMAVASVLRCYGQSDDGFTDENRPYKFGFNIEGYQHRYEEKDEKGIIMGEFGFITADGVYHLTVYATDENGDFKILKMKNIKIGLPMDKLMTTIPGVPAINPPPAKEKVEKVMNTLSGVSGCSGCLIPTTATPERGSEASRSPGAAVGATTTGPRKDPQIDVRFGQPSPKFGPTVAPDTGRMKPSTVKNENALFPTRPGSGTESPASRGGPAKTPGKMKIEDLMGILYKFNYTLTFHGHHETGDRAGNKEGGYFFNGRDGFGRDVKYVANEFGYQPNITLFELDSEGTPKEETEKLMNRLKGYEFKWFYLR